MMNGETIAYPHSITNRREIVKDTVGGANVTVTYCPMGDASVVFGGVVKFYRFAPGRPEIIRAGGFTC
jgi:hypothetical protein